MSGWTTSVLICYFIAQPLHGHDNPLTLVFALNDFASHTFLGVLLQLLPFSFEAQVNTKIGQLSAAMSPVLKRSYLSCFALIVLLDALSNQQT